jgi:protein O-GlcNAc transferase
MSRPLFEQAVEAWRTGRTALAFHFCQAALVREGESADLFRLLGSIAAQLGQYERAIDYLGGARRLAAAARRPAGDPGLLAIHPWGCGFWGEIDHVLAQLAAAEITGRQPVVYWGDRCLYRAPGVANAWEAYFKPVSAVGAEALTRPGLTYAPGRWNADTILKPAVSRDVPSERTSSLELLDASEDVAVVDCHNRLLDLLPWAPDGHWLAGLAPETAYRRLAQRHLRLADPLAETVERLAAVLVQRAPVLAVHYRTQSQIKDQESGEKSGVAMVDYLPEVDRFLAENPGGTIFLLTDFAPALRLFLERYPDRVTTLPAVRLEHEQQVEVTFLPIGARSGPPREWSSK